MVRAELMPEAVRREMAAQDEHFAGLPDKAVFKPERHPRYQRRRLEQHLAELLAALGRGLPGGESVHVACCGTGYEAEALLRAGYQVSASDLSVQALAGLAKRAAVRGYRVPYLQADVLHLPFAPDSFNLAVVVEGLHHTPDPAAGFAELVRVARRRVAIVEPYTGAVFNLLGGLRLAHRHEYGGLAPTRLTGALVRQLRGLVGGEMSRRLYLDLPPGPGVDWLGDLPGVAPVLYRLAGGLECVLSLVGVGNKVALVAEVG